MKKEFYPAEETVKVNENSVSVTLQGILDISAAHLLQHLEPVVPNLPKDANVQLWCTGGFDGSSMHKNYKQCKEVEDDTSLRSENTISLTFVALMRLTDSTGRNILWQNERWNSSSSCCPVKIEYLEETTENILEEWQDLRNQTDSLVGKTVTVGSRNVQVLYKLI